VAWAGLERVHLRRSLSRTALAFPPGLLLAVVLLGRGLPLGALTDPVAVLVDVDRVLVVPLDLRVGAGTAP
jgi:hypothetical protein